MTKRFTDANKFNDIWYRRLSLLHKAIWEYLLAECNHAGILENVDFEMMSFKIGAKVNREDLEIFKDRIFFISESTLFIPKFIEFQYGTLNPNSKVHSSVLKELKRYSIERVSKGYLKGIYTLKDKDKDKEKDINTSKEYSNLELNSIPLKEKENLTKEKESEKGEGVKALRGDESKNAIATADTGSFYFEDLYFNKQIQKVFALYKQYCPSLIPIRFENRTKGRLDEIKEFLEIVSFDFSYVEELFKRANEQKTFYKNRISLKSLIKNHAEIFEGLGAPPEIEPQGNTQINKLNPGEPPEFKTTKQLIEEEARLRNGESRP